MDESLAEAQTVPYNFCLYALNCNLPPFDPLDPHRLVAPQRISAFVAVLEA
jgi:hypothetical protein